MRVQASDIICGIEVKILRNFFKNYKYFKSDEFFKIGSKENLDCLLKNNFIQKKDKWDFSTTVKGNALSSAKFIKPVDRSKAEKLVNELIVRAKKINNDKYFITYVEKIYAFGSYIKKTQDVGDIDLVIKLSLKENITNDDVERISFERTKNKKMSYIDSVFFAQEIEPMRFLKNKQSYLSFHRMDELKQLKIKPKLIFKRKKKDE